MTEIIHSCPPDGSGLTPCCGRTPFELPLGDRISSETVTCGGAEPSDPTQCTGDEGFCPEHGFHRHSLKQPVPAEARTEGGERACDCGPTPAGCPPEADPDCPSHGDPSVLAQLPAPNPQPVAPEFFERLHRTTAREEAGPTLAGTVDNPGPLRERYAAAIDEGFRTADEIEDANLGECLTDAVLAVRDTELQQLRDRLEDVRHNLAARAFTAPDADFDTILASLDARIRDALDPGQGQPPVNPPGSTSEQLPADVLALLPIRPYLSTACETAEACETGAAVHSGERPWLHAHAEDLHHRCRLNHKFTGQPCACTCHQGQP